VEIGTGVSSILDGGAAAVVEGATLGGATLNAGDVGREPPAAMLDMPPGEGAPKSAM